MAETELFEYLESEDAKKSKILRKSPLKFSKLSYFLCILRFYICTVGNVQNIFMEHDLYLIS